MIWASVVPEAITSAARTNDDRANAESRTRLISNHEHTRDPLAYKLTTARATPVRLPVCWRLNRHGAFSRCSHTGFRWCERQHPHK